MKSRKRTTTHTSYIQPLPTDVALLNSHASWLNGSRGGTTASAAMLIVAACLGGTTATQSDAALRKLQLNSHFLLRFQVTCKQCDYSLLRYTHTDSL
jgi:hypothetical protein